MDAALSGAQFVIPLLPDTALTQNILNARTLSLLATGAFVINPGRGSLIDDAALMAALDSGKIAHATLDVFRQEPLPPGHPFWAHPKVTVTPHVASETRAYLAAGVLAENIRRGECKEAFLTLWIAKLAIKAFHAFVETTCIGKSPRARSAAGFWRF